MGDVYHYSANDRFWHNSDLPKGPRSGCDWGGKQTFNKRASNLRRRFTPPRKGEPKPTHALDLQFAPEPVTSAVTIPTQYLPVSSGRAFTANRHTAAPVPATICSRFRAISSINSLPINNHHR
jgi:hypothetical protein